MWTEGKVALAGERVSAAYQHSEYREHIVFIMLNSADRAGGHGVALRRRS